MVNQELINKNVQGNIDENTIMVFFNADLNNTAPFMCSSFEEGWIWSKDLKHLISFLFESLISNYLIGAVSAFGEFEPEDKEYGFLEAIEIYQKHQIETEERKVASNKLKSLYKQYIDKDVEYIEFIKLLCQLEEVVKDTDIDLMVETYKTPYEARHSEMLHTNKFDYENLNKNF